MSLENDLKSIGLEEKEARVYLAALELGSTNIQNLTSKSGIKRSTVYEMLKSLKSQGLISETTKGKRKLIMASDPENLKRNIKAKEQLLSNILPSLVSLSNLNPTKPKIVFYEGKEGHREIFLDTLRAKDKTAYWISPIKSLIETVGHDFMDKYIEKRAGKGIWIKLIHSLYEKKDYTFVLPDNYKKDLKKVRFTPLGMDFPNIIAVYDNKTAVMSSNQEGFGFVVESKDYAQSMRIFHDLLWNISKPWHEMDFDKNNQKSENNEAKEKEDNYWSVNK
jgi:HTH-type transcriptional regulator, sugar sensing transcriptional regulator